MSYVQNSRILTTVQSIARSVFDQSIKKARFVVLPTLGIFFVWAVAASLINDPGVLPTPLEVLEQTYRVSTTPDVFGQTALDHTWITLTRSLIMSVIILALSVVLGILMAIHRPTEDSLVNVLPFGMTAPEVVVILLCLVWVGFNVYGLALALLLVITPFGTINIWKGTKDLDNNILEMANSFNLPSRTIWRHVFIPHLLPYIMSSYRYILAMTWKITVVGEVFGLESGLGAVFRRNFRVGNIDIVLAHFVILAFVVLCLEYLILKPLENHLFKWR